MGPPSAAPAQRGFVLWLTGLSGAGKSTLAAAVHEQLGLRGDRAFVIDGDRIRQGLCADLGFSKEDRAENIRRIGEVAGLFVDAGMIVLVACISPFRADRALVRAKFGAAEFLEIYCCAPLSICESRDVKGLYAKARTGLLGEFTGISSPYEPPVDAALCVDSAQQDLGESVDAVLAMLQGRGVIESDCPR